ncbi:DUF1707 domain-containing protein [Amycolatopsis sp. GM8]|uniref:DUF1707 SHOCT-like domain-containing protein n=1 Tax=Amycolatopsis sp. GM8 TaxID=2896530 RepID=UPI001F3A76BD|nr:DUF1707 domain-containing protein [Amycolatopsis sp. GM8]
MSAQETGITTDPGAVRCSDAERERTSAALRDAAGEGRLSLSEVEERLEQVYSSRYRHELDALVADLPPAGVPSTGWTPVAAMAWRQLRDDAAVLAGRRGTAARRRKVATALVLLAALLVLAALAALALHGIVSGGLEHHGFGHD